MPEFDEELLAALKASVGEVQRVTMLGKAEDFPRRTVRLTDTGPRDHLALTEELDGDVWIEVQTKRDEIIHDPDAPDFIRAATEICTSAGGGHSPRTLRALKALAQAIRQDNEEEPRRAGQ